MKILIVSDSFYPNATMNGIVAKNLVDEINKNGENNVTILTYLNPEKVPKNYNNSKIYYVKHPYFYNNYKYRKLIFTSKNILEKNLNKTKLLITRVFSFIFRNINFLGINKNVSKKICEELNLIIEKENIDTIFLISAPFEIFYSALILKKSKNKKIKILGHQIDFFITLEDKFYPEFLRKFRKMKRIKMLKECNEYFNMLYMLPFVFKKEFKYLERKSHVRECELPLIIKNNFIDRIKSNEKTNNILFTYTGSLDLKERPPVEIIELFNKINEKNNVKLCFYHKGNCHSIIASYSTKYKGLIEDYGNQSVDICYQAMAKSDFLISIGTITGNQIAGKTYDYISTGKPIIYFYFNDYDLNKNYFLDYPLALCVQLKDELQNINILKIKDFINKTKGKFLSFEEIEKKYTNNLPSTIVKKIFK